MSVGGQPVNTSRRRYVNAGYITDLLPRLSDRDFAILDTLAHVRVASGVQLSRLHFINISPLTRDRTRRVVLSRLSEWGLIAPLERSIGGVRAGSSGLVFSLDAAGQKLIRLRYPETFENEQRARRPTTPGRMFLAHALAVTELCVSLSESIREGDIKLDAFDAEPRSWWANGLGAWLKPDAYLRLRFPTFIDHWWIEVDRATESLTTLRQKLTTYLDFYNQGQRGPNNLMPRVLITVPSIQRREAVRELLERLPEPAQALFLVTLDKDAVLALLGRLDD